MNLQYSHIGGADQTLSEIKVVKQKPDESAGSYGQRVEILLNRLQNSYDVDRSLLDFERFTCSSVKQLYMPHAIKKDCIKKLRDRRVKDELTSNSNVQNVKLIRNKYRLKPRSDHSLNITIFQDKEKAYLVKKVSV